MGSVVIEYLFVISLQVEEGLESLRLDDSHYEQVMELMEESMNKGLRSKSDISNDLKMYITYVRSLPDGSGLCTSLCRLSPVTLGCAAG